MKELAGIIFAVAVLLAILIPLIDVAVLAE